MGGQKLNTILCSSLLNQLTLKVNKVGNGWAGYLSAQESDGGSAARREVGNCRPIAGPRARA